MTLEEKRAFKEENLKGKEKRKLIAFKGFHQEIEIEVMFHS